MTIPILFNTLRQTPKYEGLTDYYIKKRIMDEYKVDKVNKPELEKALTNTKIQTVSKHNVDVNQDVLYNILLHAAPKDMTPLCSTNKQTLAICHNQHFWLEKIKQYHVEQFVDTQEKTMKQWIDAFRVTDFKHNAAIVLDMILKKLYTPYAVVFFEFNEHDNVNDISPIPIDRDKIVLKYKKYKHARQNLNVSREYDAIQLRYIVRNQIELNQVITEQDLLLMIMKFMYYFPKHDISDDHGLSLLSIRKLNTSKKYHQNVKKIDERIDMIKQFIPV